MIFKVAEAGEVRVEMHAHGADRAVTGFGDDALADIMRVVHALLPVHVFVTADLGLGSCEVIFFAAAFTTTSASGLYSHSRASAR